MKIYLVSTIVLCSWLQPSITSANPLTLDEELSYQAEVQGYGFKSSNLTVLKKSLGSILLQQNLSPYEVKVPDFLAISSQEIQNVLKDHGLDIELEWKKIVLGYEFDIQNLTEVGHGKSIHEQAFDSFVSRSEKLAYDIVQKFQFLSQKPEPVEALEQIYAKDSFKYRASNSSWRLMVRSTGREDSKLLANAGGNYSEANVIPESAKITQAIGRVVSSYFLKKSLVQRKIAHDPTLFDNNIVPLTPVLLQKMVGERKNIYEVTSSEKIPRGCVAYSEEPSGNLASVNLIQCAYGHNEAVVQSLVPLDSYYYDKNGLQHSVIRQKPNRLVPNNKGLVFADNPPELVEKAALNQIEVRAIAKIIEHLEAVYKQALDIELVFMPDIKTFYVVQARPLVKAVFDENPSYLSNVGSIDEKLIVRADTINPGSGAVLSIQQSAEILVAKTLEDALQKYIESKDKNQVKAVVVQEKADATSHASATFRGEGKTILIAHNYIQLVEWLNSEKVNLLIDVQRGVILNKLNIEPNSDLAMISSGWLNYPLPLLVSVVPDSLATNCHTIQDKGYYSDSCGLSQVEQEIENIDEFARDLKQKQAAASSDVEKSAVGDFLTKANKLSAYAHQLFEEKKRKVAQEDNALSVLFTERFLHSLLFQQLGPGTAQAYSLASLKAEYESKKEFLSDLFSHRKDEKVLFSDFLRDQTAYDLAYLGFKASPEPELKFKWYSFISDLGKSRSSYRNELKLFVDSLQKLGIFDLWLNEIFFFSQCQDEAPGSGIISSALKPVWRSTNRSPSITCLFDFKSIMDGEEESQQYAREKKYFFRDAMNVEKILKSYDPKLWTGTEQFHKNLNFFEENISKFFRDELLINQLFSDKGGLKVLTMIHLLKKYIEAFDLSIKSFKSSVVTDKRKKLIEFHTMLSSFSATLLTWVRAMPNSEMGFWYEYWTNKEDKSEDFKSRAKLKSYVELIKRNLGKKGQSVEINEKDFFTSEKFNVTEKTEPKTLEDIFTATHQSFNEVLQIFSARVLKRDRPAIVEAIFKSQKVFFLGSKNTNELQIFNYEFPLREHAARITIYHNPSSLQTDLSIYLYGNNERCRWFAITDYVEIWAASNGIKFTNEDLAEKHVSFKIDNVEKVSAQLNSLLGQISALTYDLAYGYFENGGYQENEKCQGEKSYFSNYVNSVIPQVKKKITVQEVIDSNLVEKLLANDQGRASSASTILLLFLLQSSNDKGVKEYVGNQIKKMNFTNDAKGVTYQQMLKGY